VETAMDVRKNASAKCCKKQKSEIKMPKIFHTSENEIKMQRKISVLQ